MKDPIKARRYMVKTSLRSQWLRSPERAAALKRDGYSCCKCGIKQSKSKGREVSVQVHHIKGIMDWNKTIDGVLSSGLFCGPEGLQTLCKKCHHELDERN